MKITYMAYDEISRECREFETKKEADVFVKNAKKEDKRTKTNSKWRIFREEKY